MYLYLNHYILVILLRTVCIWDGVSYFTLSLTSNVLPRKNKLHGSCDIRDSINWVGVTSPPDGGLWRLTSDRCTDKRSMLQWRTKARVCLSLEFRSRPRKNKPLHSDFLQSINHETDFNQLFTSAIKTFMPFQIVPN